MIQLKQEFDKKGTHYKQIYKSKALVLYQLSRFYKEYGITVQHYEIFRYVTHTPDKYHNDEYELYPCDEAFGRWAWSCSNEASLLKIYKKHFNNDIEEQLKVCIKQK